MTETAVLAYFPGNTFNAPAADMEAIATSFPERPQGVRFKAIFDKQGYHGTSYDSYAANTQFMADTLALTR
jgi:hypothetical protein